MVEVAPLAFMRGRTLNDSFIILDEAQNTSPEQMQMFLTRLGFGSKIVVTGDITQIDLPREQRSGLVHVMKVLDDVPRYLVRAVLRRRRRAPQARAANRERLQDSRRAEWPGPAGVTVAVAVENRSGWALDEAAAVEVLRGGASAGGRR